MGDYAAFVVRFDPSVAVPVLEALKRGGARDVQLFGNGAVVGLWKTSGGPGTIKHEVEEILYSVETSRDSWKCRLDTWQLFIIHERHNAVDDKSAVIEL